MTFQIKQQPFIFTERRKQKRLNFSFLVKYRLKGQPVFNTALFNNVSNEGMLLQGSTGYQTGDVLEISFSFLEDKHLSYATMDGIIIWNKKNEKRNNSLDWRMGIKLFPPPQEREQTLKRFIDHYSKNELAEDQVYKVPVQARDFFIRGIKSFEDKPADALMDFNQVIELNPEHSAAYCYRAFLKDRLGDTQGASEDFNKAHKLGGI